MQNSQQNTCACASACNFIKKETLAQVFSCEFCKISKNTFFIDYLRVTAFVTTQLQLVKVSWISSTSIMQILLCLIWTPQHIFVNTEYLTRINFRVYKILHFCKFFICSGKFTQAKHIFQKPLHLWWFSYIKLILLEAWFTSKVMHVRYAVHKFITIQLQSNISQWKLITTIKESIKF